MGSSALTRCFLARWPSTGRDRDRAGPKWRSSTRWRAAAPRFAEARELRYRETVRYDSFATFVEEVAGTTFSEFPRERLDTPEVRAMFEAGRTDDGYVFTQHNRVNLYRRLHP